MPKASQCNRASGFTLLEVLVVLILVSLLSALLLWGVTYTLKLKTGYSRLLEQSHQTRLLNHWLRSAISGLYPASRPQNRPFKGDKQSFSGQSLTSLHGLNGVPTFFELQLQQQRQTRLVYRYEQADGSEAEWLLATYDTRRSRIIYLDESLNPHSQWPPSSDLTHTLPQAIAITILTDPPVHWLVALKNRKTPKRELSEILKQMEFM
ncbi:prepilin-type N-terminal cleavage/methylation domain-containing protein [Ectothiorhodospiraceae bacterium BW-2]|nr:prepilin-type N-terminal cleavage/methylation domain-containing protein [Ectothiorhodospiraceae bacterium BW-2]